MSLCEVLTWVGHIVTTSFERVNEGKGSYKKTHRCIFFPVKLIANYFDTLNITSDLK
jgi:hypothetical protein